MDKRPVAIIVDAYSSGSLYPEAFRARGISCIHVASRNEPPVHLLRSFKKVDFLECFQNDGDISKLSLDISQKYYPKAVIPGCEIAIEFADKLAKALCLKGNSVQSSECRRDKYHMIEKIRSSGLAAARQISSGRLEDFVNFFNREKGKIVIKPRRSAGSDEVHLCKNIPDIEKSFQKIYHKKSHLDEINQEVLAQQYLDGDQYIINTVSSHSVHRCVALMRIHMKPNYPVAFIQDRVTFLPMDENFDIIINYAYSVLAALDIQFGPAHLEIMLCKNGPVLVEAAARPVGAFVPILEKACTGYSSIEAGCDAWTAPDKIEKLPLRYKLLKRGEFVLLHSDQEGKIQSLNNIDELKKLDSFLFENLTGKLGSELKKTKDLSSYAGIVLLAHQNPEILQNDLKKVRELESNGFFVIDNK